MDGRLEDNLIFDKKSLWRLDLGNAYEDREDNRQEDDDKWRNWRVNDWQF